MPRPSPDAPEPALSATTAASLATTVAAGDLRATLSALRDSIAEAMAAASPSEVASLSKQMRDTLAAIDAIRMPASASRADEVAAARAARLAGSAVPARPAREVASGAGSDRPGRKRRATPRSVAEG